MESLGDDSVELSRWLQEVARRRAETVTQRSADSIAEPLESGDDALGYLEQLLGRKLRSREAIDSFLKELAADEAARAHAATRRRIVRESILLGALIASYLHYYYWDVHLQIASMQQMRVYLPVIEHRDLGRAGGKTA